MYPDTHQRFPSWCAVDTLFRTFLDGQVAICRTADLGSIEQYELPSYISVPVLYGNA